MRPTTLFFLLVHIVVSAQSVENAQIVLNTGGHLASVKAIQFSPDGKLLYSISDDKTVRVWDIDKEACIRTFRGYAEPGRVGMLNSGLLTPEREILAVGGYLGQGDEETGEIRLMNSYTGNIVVVLRGHPSPVISLGCTPEEDYLVSGSTDGSVGIWSLSTGKGIKLSGHEEEVYVTQFSPDGTQLLTAGYDSVAILWNFREMLETGEPQVVELTEQQDRIRSAAFSPDGNYIVTAGFDQRVLLYDSEGNFIRTLIELNDGGFDGVGDIHSISISSDSKVIAIGTMQLTGGNAMTYSFPDGEPLHEFMGNDNTVIASAMYGERLVATSGGANRDIYIWDAYTGEVKAHLAGQGQRVYKVAAGSNNRIALGFEPNDTPMINNFGKVNTQFDLNSLQLESFDASSYDFTSEVMEWSGMRLGQTGAYSLAVVHPDNSIVRIEVDPGTEGNINCFSFTPNGDVAIGTTFDLILYSNDGKYLKAFRGHVADVYSLAFNADMGLMYSASADNTTRIWDLTQEGEREVSMTDFERMIRERYGSERVDGLIATKGEAIIQEFYNDSYPKIVEPKATLFVSANMDWVLWTDQRYYAASRQGSSFVGFHKNLDTDTLADFFTFEQYDVLWNRPDKVMEILNTGNDELIELYHLAYLKRLRKLGLNEEALQDVEGAPSIEVRTSDQTVEESRFGFNHMMFDFKHHIAREHVTINGVPVFGVEGLGFSDNPNIDPAAMQVNLLHTQLSPGMNKVQMWCSNTKGIQSNRETRYIYFDTVDVKPDLYILGLGASQYKQSDFNLRYADKDVRDFVRFYGQTELYEQIIVDTLFNEAVTKRQIEAALERLKAARVYDHVLIYIAGHGVLDEELNYYLATYDMDFDSPAEKGLDYGWLEDRIAGLNARTRTVFIDACHSGEVDMEETKRVEQMAQGVTAHQSRGAQVGSTGYEENDVYKVMNLLFSDLRNNSGATIIASAGGSEYAYEGEEWSNGVFTYVLLNALKDGSADANGDGEVHLSELKRVVQQKVQILTGGRQVPTTRFENVSQDYQFW